MAKYAKRKTKKKTSRRRRVGAATGILNPKSPVLLVGTAIATYFLAGDMINEGIDKLVPATMQANTNYPLISGGVEAGGGLLLAMKGKKTVVNQVVGGVLLGAGLKRVLAKVGIGGFRDIPAVGTTRRRMGGFREIPAVGSGFNPLQAGNRSLGQWQPNPAARSLGAVGAAGAGCF